jgi:hypothetical protein
MSLERRDRHRESRLASVCQMPLGGKHHLVQRGAPAPRAVDERRCTRRQRAVYR